MNSRRGSAETNVIRTARKSKGVNRKGCRRRAGGGDSSVRIHIGIWMSGRAGHPCGGEMPGMLRIPLLNMCRHDGGHAFCALSMIGCKRLSYVSETPRPTMPLVTFPDSCFIAGDVCIVQCNRWCPLRLRSKPVRTFPDIVVSCEEIDRNNTGGHNA